MSPDRRAGLDRGVSPEAEVVRRSERRRDEADIQRNVIIVIHLIVVLGWTAMTAFLIDIQFFRLSLMRSLH